MLIFNHLEHTARLLNDLTRQEILKGFPLPKTENLSPKQEEALKFLQRIHEINPVVALLLATQFRTLREILNRFEISLIFEASNRIVCEPDSCSRQQACLPYISS